MNITDNGINLIKEFEGFKASPYLCPAGKWTIGYGTTSGITKDTPAITEEQAEQLLKYNLRWVEKTIKSSVCVDLTQNEYDALCSFIYNIGGSAFRGSTLLKLLNDENYLDAADEFLKWCHVNKEVNQGLLRRRKAERDLFLKD